MLMGSKTSSILCFLILCNLYSSLLIHAVESNARISSLDDFFQDYAQNSLPKRPRTGTLYNVSLPSNFTGMEASIVRFRSSSVLRKGANFSHFNIPSRIITKPFFTRLDVVISNLGNWSTYYYNVPNYAFVTPVIGFNVYGSRNVTGQIGNLTTPTTRLNLTVTGDPILVRFPRGGENAKCVAFYPNGTVEMTKMTLENICVVWDQGHFSVAVQILPQPSSPPPSPRTRKEKGQLWKWWVIGFGVGVVGLLLCGFVIIMIIRFVRMKRIGKMEKEADKNEVLDTRYVGHLRMPSASGVRTQPIIENDYIP